MILGHIQYWLNHSGVSPFNSVIILSVIYLSFNADKPSLGMVVTAVLVTILSWVVAIIVNVLTALVVGVAGRSMSWFTHTPLLLPLYAIPALLAMAEVHSFWLKNVQIWCIIPLVQIMSVLKKREKAYIYKVEILTTV